MVRLAIRLFLYAVRVPTQPIPKETVGTFTGFDECQDETFCILLLTLLACPELLISVAGQRYLLALALNFLNILMLK